MRREDGMSERLLRWAVDDSEASEGLLGDLNEEYADRTRSYRLAVTGLALRYLWRRAVTPSPDREWFAESGRVVGHAARSLMRAPGYSAGVVLTLGLGLAATAAVFSVLHRVVLAPLPYAHEDRLVQIRSAVPGLGPDEMWNVAKGQYLYLRDNARTLEDIGLYVYDVATLGFDEEAGLGASRVRIALVNPETFTTLGIEPGLGRAFSVEESLARAPLVILSDGFWERAYARDPGVLGQTIAVQGSPLTIIGVLPPEVRLPEEASSPDDPVSLWLPLDVNPSEAARNNHVWRALARVAPGTDLASVSDELTLLTSRFPEVMPDAYSQAFLDEYQYRTVALPLRNAVVGSAARTLWIVFGSVALLLLVACFNAANLVLARTEQRRREIAIRSALGAGTITLARQLLTESCILALLAGGGAVVVARAAVPLIVAAAPAGIPRLHEAQIGWLGGALTIALALAIGVSFGLVPLVGKIRTQALRESGRGQTASRSQHRVRRALVVAQLAASVMLLAGASLLLESFRRLRSVDTGVDAQGVFTFRVILPADPYGNFERTALYYRQATEAIENIPAVVRAGTINALPLDGYDGCAAVFFMEADVASGTDAPCEEVFLVGPGYFEAIGTPLSGIDATWDDIADQHVTAVVTESFATRYWGTADAVGQSVSGFGATFAPVVGVAGDVRGAGLDQPAWNALYLSFMPENGRGNWAVPRFMYFVVRAEGAAAGSIEAQVRETVEAIDRSVPLVDFRTMDSIVRASTAEDSFVALLMGIASFFSLLLSAIGVYAVVSYTVQSRRPEIGVRLALGARRGEVQTMVVAQSVVMAAAGVGVGVLAVIPLGRVLGSTLYGVDPVDPVILASAAITLVVVTALAALGPARRATRIDPVEALRAE